MRILIISYFFPPYNTIGSVRIGKIAKYFHEHGHDVRVITADKQYLSGPLKPNLEIEIPKEKISYTKWLLFTNFHKNSRNGHIRWLPFSYKEASKLLQNWKPDLIYASALPTVSLITTHMIARKYRIPWVAELRDLWVDNHIIQYSSLRKIFETWLEAKVLSSAQAFVTVSEPLADVLRKKFNKPTAVVLNGFDPGDYPSEIEEHKGEGLSIVYTGSLYHGKRDPSPLFKAVKKLGPLSSKIIISYYGPDFLLFKKIAENHQVENLVSVFSTIPYQAALKSQMEADILLLLLWNHPQERGVYTGKIFEYIGARRPILAIGPEDNVASDLIRDRELGFVSHNPSEIAEKLSYWIEEKKSTVIENIPLEKLGGFSREEQVSNLESFLKDLI
jgi:glycosyltransferase involved in cell wall biosynthesis